MTTCLGGGTREPALFVKDMKILERGWRVWSAKHGKEVVVWGRLFMNIADFPAAQEMSGSLGISALHPCRLCLAKKGSYGCAWSLRLDENPTKGRDWLLQNVQAYRVELGKVYLFVWRHKTVFCYKHMIQNTCTWCSAYCIGVGTQGKSTRHVEELWTERKNKI